MEEVYKNIVETYYPSILRTARYLDRDQYEDIANDTVVRILSRSSPLVSETNLEGFCVSETYRAFYDMRRKQRAVKRGGGIQHEELINDLDVTLPHNQEVSVELNEVMRAILSMKEKPRQLMLLTIFFGQDETEFQRRNGEKTEGLNQDDIAKVVGLKNRNTVQTTIYRARKQLKELVA